MVGEYPKSVAIPAAGASGNGANKCMISIPIGLHTFQGHDFSLQDFPSRIEGAIVELHRYILGLKSAQVYLRSYLELVAYVELGGRLRLHVIHPDL